MASPEIVRTGSSELIVQSLPDGSTAIFEVATKNVYSLNPSAAAAWDACASATTLPELAAAMSRALHAPVTEDLANEAVRELVDAGLVTVTPIEPLGASRRAMLKQVAGVALPVVLVLTGAQQRAHAQDAVSEQNPPATTPLPTTTRRPPTTPGPTTTQPPVMFTIFKGVGAIDPVPLEGAEFDVKNGSGQVVAHLVTDASGKASVNLPPGVYTLVETFAPGGPYVPFPPALITLTAGQDRVLDRRNILVSG
jgi:hypothetical protein